MSEFRPHVREKRFPPIKDESLLVGPVESWTPQRRAEWLRQQPKEFQNAARDQLHRFDLIQKATKKGLLGWEQDYTHYRDGSPYCKCPGGSVNAHNERFEKILQEVDDGR